MDQFKAANSKESERKIERMFFKQTVKTKLVSLCLWIAFPDSYPVDAAFS